MKPASFRPALEQAFESALDHVSSLDQAPAGATATHSQLLAALRKELQDDPLAAEAVIRDLVADARPGLLGTAGGRFFAWAIGSSVPAALAADWLTSAWDQAAALYACSPAAGVVEEVAGEWLKDLLGLPRGASYAFVSGCQMAHATCLAAARHELLQRRGWDVETKGLAGSPSLRILTSNGHGSLERAVRLLGLGSSHIVELELDACEQLVPASLELALQAGEPESAIVILQAGDLNTGSFDKYEEFIPIARRYGAWVHIDGAFGLWAAASPRLRHLLAGAAQADSWSTDGHKWLNVPYDCGYAFVAHPEAHRAAMGHRAPYLIHGDGVRDQIDWNPEWSRRARGFPTYAALRQMGRNGLARMIEDCCDCAAGLIEGMSKLPGVRVLWTPVINQGLVRFLDPSPAATEADHDRFTDLVTQRIGAHGGAFFAATTWRGMRAMRVSVLSWRTDSADVQRAIAAVAEVLEIVRQS